MFFRQVLDDERSCASHVVGCPSEGVAAVVDPQGEPGRYIDLAGRHGLEITHVIDTHVHADHVSSARALSDETGAPLFLGAGTEAGFEHAALDDGEVVKVGNRRIHVIHTPGHTPEHVSLFVDEWFVLTGDTLFVGDVGRVDLALENIDEAEMERRAKELHASLHRLLDLEDHVEVYPGHYAGSTCGRGMDGKTISTIGRERRTNRALSMSADEFVEFQMSNVPPLPQDFTGIKRTNIAAS